MVEGIAVLVRQAVAKTHPCLLPWSALCMEMGSDIARRPAQDEFLAECYNSLSVLQPIGSRCHFKHHISYKFTTWQAAEECNCNATSRSPHNS